MNQDNYQPKKSSRTIRSETTKVFLVIFALLLTIGSFTIYSTRKGAQTFQKVRNVYLQQFRDTETMKQKALDVIAVSYALSSDQNQDLLMEELLRYDGLIKDYSESYNRLKKSLNSHHADTKNQMELMGSIKTSFDSLITNCRQMTFASLEGNKEKSSQFFAKVNREIKSLKKHLDDFETKISSQLQTSTDEAQTLLSKTTYFGAVITFLAILLTLVMISYLMKFLSITLLPISNMMHNMRQAVFAPRQ